MSTFRRALRWFFGLVGFFLGLMTAIAAYAAKIMIMPSRQQLSASPADIGLDFEEVQFPAQDGLRVSGWFVPAGGNISGNGATIILVHGWQWNRMGYDNENLVANITGSSAVDLLGLIADLNAGGYNILTFDLRNHGLSAAARPVTFGQSEAKDLLGALAYLDGREDIDSERIGVMGFSIGANTVLFALPQTRGIKAAMVVQPMTPSVFTRRFFDDLFAVFSAPINALSTTFYRLLGATRLSGIVPAFAAAGSGDVPVLFVQGTGDAWGLLEDVSNMAEMTPGTEQLLFVNSQDRFGGYSYVLNHPELASRFFQRHLDSS